MKYLFFVVMFAVSATTYAVEFDQQAYRERLKITIEKAGISTNLHLSCSDSGKIKTEELIQSIKDKALQLPVKNSLELANNLESSYRAIFKCETALKKALSHGFSAEQISLAINQEELSENESSDSDFDLEGFRKNLEESFTLLRK